MPRATLRSADRRRSSRRRENRCEGGGAIGEMGPLASALTDAGKRRQGATARASEGPRPEDRSDFVALLWDPIHPIAADVLQFTWEPVRHQITDALTVVLELAMGSRVKLKDAEIAAFYFTLLKVLSAGVAMSEERRTVFLQESAAYIFFRHRLQGFPTPEAYWDFLNQRHAEYAAAAKTARDTKPLITFIDHFLCYFDLGGSDNVDVVYGLYRFLSPLLAEATQLLRERAAQAWG